MKDMVLYMSQSEMQVARLGVFVRMSTSLVKRTLQLIW